MSINSQSVISIIAILFSQCAFILSADHEISAWCNLPSDITTHEAFRDCDDAYKKGPAKDFLVLAFQLHIFPGILHCAARHCLRNPPLDIIFLETDDTFYDAFTDTFGLNASKSQRNWKPIVVNLRAALKKEALLNAPVCVLPSEIYEKNPLGNEMTFFQNGYQCDHHSGGNYLTTITSFQNPYNDMQKKYKLLRFRNSYGYYCLVPEKNYIKIMNTYDFFIHNEPDGGIGIIKRDHDGSYDGMLKFHKSDTSAILSLIGADESGEAHCHYQLIRTMEGILLAYCYKKDKHRTAIQEKFPDLKPREKIDTAAPSYLTQSVITVTSRLHTLFTNLPLYEQFHARLKDMKYWLNIREEPIKVDIYVYYK